MTTVRTGNLGEDLACEYLKKQGYKILERNYRIRGGEIDIVEVKARLSHEYGKPAESMTPWKIKYLIKTAKFYVNRINWGSRPYRLDFIGIDYADDRDNPTIELIKNITS
ncbi:YraN family protein [Candidatus Daviesbacteria bacterium]|nr:YraN family protein [Candidatus Daviesbacteria bacterium]